MKRDLAFFGICPAGKQLYGNTDFCISDGIVLMDNDFLEQDKIRTRH